MYFAATYFYTVIRQSWHVVDGQMHNSSATVRNVPEALDWNLNCTKYMKMMVELISMTAKKTQKKS